MSRLLLLVTTSFVLLALPSAASAADVQVAFSADATEEKPFTATVSGSTEVGRRLFVFVSQSASGCPSTPSSNYGSATTTLSSSFGDTINAGSYSETYTYTPANSGNYRICAYVAEDSTSSPNASATSTFTVPGPPPVVTPPAPTPPVMTPPAVQPASLAVATPASVTAGSSVNITTSGSVPSTRSVWSFVAPSSVSCASTARRHGQQQGAEPVTVARTVGPGSISFSASWLSRSPGEHRVCSYLAASETATADATATTTFKVTEDPTLLPVLVTRDGEEDRDRLVLVWRRGRDSDRDRVFVYDRKPASGVSPIARYDAEDGDDVELERQGANWRAKLRRHLGYGVLYWRINRTDANSNTVTSAARSVTVVPRPLNASLAKAVDRVTLRSSSKRPGSVRLIITSSPLAKVKLTIRRAGRVFARRSYIAGVGVRRGFDFALSCGRTGQFAYTAAITDPYGTKLTRRGSWTVSAARCQRLVAKEQAAVRRKLEAQRRKAAAERRAAERKREEARRREQARQQEEQQQQSDNDSGGGSSGGGGGGGCDGDPGATPFPQFPGQRDGDGDGCYGES